MLRIESVNNPSLQNRVLVLKSIQAKDKVSTVNLLLNCTSTLLYVCVCCACVSINCNSRAASVACKFQIIFFIVLGPIFGRSNGTNPGLKLLVRAYVSFVPKHFVR